jgi:hypothetical protein
MFELHEYFDLFHNLVDLIILPRSDALTSNLSMPRRVRSKVDRGE